MTENKRFTITQDFEEHHRQIRDNGHIIMGCFIEPQAKVIVDMLNELNVENEKLKSENQRVSEQKHIYKQDWKHLCIDKELLDSENEKLKEDNAILKHALSRIICEFDEHIAKNSEFRDLIK